MSIVNTLTKVFGQNVPFTLLSAYSACPDVNKDSVRARIYEHLGDVFIRLGKGLYATKNAEAILIEGDGRDLSVIADGSIDCIITDHPWDSRMNRGGNRNFTNYDTFCYTPRDFAEKARVLKEGSFLCECLPAENEANFDYLYAIKKMAEAAGFRYYCKVPWIKGTFVSNTGRCAKNYEEIMIFSKGKARCLRPDSKRGGTMSGANGMLPAAFNVQAVPASKRIAQSEKPVALFERLLEFVSQEDEVVLDQFAGSGSVGEACMHAGRRCILFEKAHSLVQAISLRLDLTAISYG